MGKNSERFAHLLYEVDEEKTQEETSEEIRDMATFVNTMAFKRMMKWLDERIANQRFVEGMSDADAKNALIRQSAYREMADEVQMLVALTKEKIDA